ncbi:MAG TPA: Maf family protein [Bacillota bacterium]|jgi:septum formation protein
MDIQLILASTSPRRRTLLEQIGIPFEVVASEVDEKLIEGTPVQQARALALTKARAVAASRRAGLVIGADTIVVVGSAILGKPMDRKEARMMLGLLAGRRHQVITGVAVVDAAGGREVVGHEETAVWIRSLSAGEIERYAASGEPDDKAGAYAIQGLGSLLVERIEGCYFNVVGLPLVRLDRMLSEFGVHLL